MNEQDILQNLNSWAGQNQDERSPPQLDPASARVDARTPADLLAQAQRLAPHIRFFRSRPDVPDGDWSAFFPADGTADLLDRQDGQVPPHQALHAAFLHLYAYPQAAINRLTAAHMDFQYRDVLGFRERPAAPDSAHVIVELKKGAAPVAIKTGQLFSAGKDGGGAERLYQPVREVVAGHGKVAAIKAVHRAGDELYFAPVANSPDGLGGETDETEPRWRPFGHADLPLAQPGFALASPLLRLAEGERSIALQLDLSNLAAKHSAAALAGAFDAYLSGPKGWLGPYQPVGSATAKGVNLKIDIPAAEAAVTDYDPALHGQSYAAHAPVLHLQLRQGGTLRYGELATLLLEKASLSVKAGGIKKLLLENDLGSLDGRRAFQPFGPQPVAGGRFMVGCEEALSKPLADLSIKLAWQGAPPDLHDWYAGYAKQARMQDGVSVKLIYRDGGGQQEPISCNLMACVNGVSTLSPRAPSVAKAGVSPQHGLYALLHAGSARARLIAGRKMLAQPIFLRAAHHEPRMRSGYVTVELEEDFLHADYLKHVVDSAIGKTQNTLKPPYTPTVREISLGYESKQAELNLSGSTEESFGSLELQFFHVGCFGQRREHSFLRNQYPFLADKRVGLLPAYPYEGELLIGLTGVAAGDSISLLMQVAEDSADPELPPQKLEWSVLCDNYWRPFLPAEPVLDQSHELRTSGVLAVTLPAAATTVHTFMPGGMVWLRAVARQGSAAACWLRDIMANAVETVCAGAGDARRTPAALPPGSISKLKLPLAGVKSVSQPFAGFGGRMPESHEQMRQRAAERLRHRNRCLTVWDYERMVLETFPVVHQVKCIPHASGTSWLAPGHVMLVVIPNLRRRNAVDMLRPRLDIDTLSRIEEFVQRHCGMQVKLVVKNPCYQPVRLAFKVRMRPGFSFNYYSAELQQALCQALSPWAFEDGRQVEFGGHVYRSVLLDFVEELPYVDFVTDFRMQTGQAPGNWSADLAEAAAATPDAILVSAARHEIGEVAGS